MENSYWIKGVDSGASMLSIDITLGIASALLACVIYYAIRQRAAPKKD
jgi:hypothetical protein